MWERTDRSIYTQLRWMRSHELTVPCCSSCACESVSSAWASAWQSRTVCAHRVWKASADGIRGGAQLEELALH